MFSVKFQVVSDILRFWVWLFWGHTAAWLGLDEGHKDDKGERSVALSFHFRLTLKAVKAD